MLKNMILAFTDWYIRPLGYGVYRRQEYEILYAYWEDMTQICNEYSMWGLNYEGLREQIRAEIYAELYEKKLQPRHKAAVVEQENNVVRVDFWA